MLAKSLDVANLEFHATANNNNDGQTLVTTKDPILAIKLIFYRRDRSCFRAMYTTDIYTVNLRK